MAGDRRPGSLGRTPNQLGELLLAQGEPPEARACLLDVLRVMREAQLAPIMLDALLGLAAVPRAEGRSERAITLLLPSSGTRPPWSRRGEASVSNGQQAAMRHLA